LPTFNGVPIKKQLRVKEVEKVSNFDVRIEENCGD
jgi:hypothetical protein